MLDHRDINTVFGERTAAGWVVKVTGGRITGVGEGESLGEAISAANSDYTKKWDIDFLERTGGLI